jgi:hypothetical protein
MMKIYRRIDWFVDYTLIFVLNFLKLQISHLLEFGKTSSMELVLQIDALTNKPTIGLTTLYEVQNKQMHFY